MQYSKINHLLSLHEVTTPKATLKKILSLSKKRCNKRRKRKKYTFYCNYFSNILAFIRIMRYICINMIPKLTNY